MNPTSNPLPLGGQTVWWIILLSVLVTAGRFLVPGHGLSPAGTYEACAHVWVGFLVALAIFPPALGTATPGRVRWAAVACLAVSSAVETVMFLAR